MVSGRYKNYTKKHRNHGYENRGRKTSKLHVVRRRWVNVRTATAHLRTKSFRSLFLRWSQMVLTQCDCRAFECQSGFCVSLSILFSCAVLCCRRCRARRPCPWPVPVRSACRVHHQYDFSSVCSRCPSLCVCGWYVCFSKPLTFHKGFHVFCLPQLFQALFET